MVSFQVCAGSSNVFHGSQAPSPGKPSRGSALLSAKSCRWNLVTSIICVIHISIISYAQQIGGKNPNIIFDDADLDQCVATTVRSSFANQGEICLCGSRIFVQKTIYDKFLKKFVDQTAKLVVGDPRDPKTNLGALVSQQHLESVLGYVRIAEKEGGEIVFGGKRVHPPNSQYTNELLEDGYYMQPTIIAAESLSDPFKKPMDPMICRITQEEVFGPVVTVTPFEDEKQVIEWANGVRYGLSASVWTENGRRQRRVAEALRVGTVWVNCWMVRDLK